MAANPLIAILRGLEPQNAVSVAEVLVDAGFQIIEVPLNSPQPFDSISKIAKCHGANAIVGAGTVLTVPDVHAVADAGGQIIVSPNMNPDVGRAAIDRGLYWCPGVITPTEAFAALEIGAAVLKIFPAEMVPPFGSCGSARRSTRGYFRCGGRGYFSRQYGALLECRHKWVWARLGSFQTEL